MTMNKVADRIDIRYAGNEIQDTGAESHVRGGSDIEYKSAEEKKSMDLRNFLKTLVE